MSEPRLQGKSHGIPKRLIWAAWLKVKSKGGAAGADGVTIEQFEVRLQDNLFKLWNRMSSGSYFPGPVRAVEIPKKGGTRVLGIPNVVDRVAQTAAAMELEPSVEKVFHDDSYGYRPGRSPIDAVRVCRQRCFQRDWVVDLDVKAFFDSVPWDLMLKAVARHTTQKWVLLYVERWLKAPMLMPDGTLTHRVKGTPQGGPISPLIANIFLHYGFDMWMVREFPGVRFERFADDAVVHCVTERQARQVCDAIGRRLAEVGLQLHPDKTRIVYCKNSLRRQDYDLVTFTFCGYAFRPREAYNKVRKESYTGFLPAVAGPLRSRSRTG
jgi:RNA-directed DNA polymerase